MLGNSSEAGSNGSFHPRHGADYPSDGCILTEERGLPVAGRAHIW
jgi:hypothetical protein